MSKGIFFDHKFLLHSCFLYKLCKIDCVDVRTSSLQFVVISSLVSKHQICPYFKFSNQKLIEISKSEVVSFQYESRYHYQIHMRRFNIIKKGKDGGHSIIFIYHPALLKRHYFLSNRLSLANVTQNWF